MIRHNLIMICFKAHKQIIQYISNIILYYQKMRPIGRRALYPHA